MNWSGHGLMDLTGYSAWKTAAVFANFSSARGGRAVYDTTGLLLFDRQNLYFSFPCLDENLAALTENDSIEMRISFNPSGKCF